VQLLAEFGLERPPAETQAEFARRATVFLTGRGSGTEDVADVPRLVIDAFYRVRFGQLDLSPDDLKHLETRLDALEASLRPTRA
jgi:protein-glutamine gamma-glutamyltransferase